PSVVDVLVAELRGGEGHGVGARPGEADAEDPDGAGGLLPVLGRLLRVGRCRDGRVSCLALRTVVLEMETSVSYFYIVYGRIAMMICGAGRGHGSAYADVSPQITLAFYDQEGFHSLLPFG